MIQPGKKAFESNELNPAHQPRCQPNQRERKRERQTKKRERERDEQGERRR
jgi:hypothetical protein